MPLERYPDLELQLQVSEKRLTHNLLLEELDIIYVVGLFDGRPFLELEGWLKPGRHLVFLEDDLEAVRRAVSMEWAKRCFHHPQVHLKFLQGNQEWALEQIAKEFPCHRAAIIGRKSKLKLSLLRKTVLWHSAISEVLSGHLLFHNIRSNFYRMPKNFYVNQTRDAFKNCPIIICGAGPSLSTAMGEIAKLQDRALIIGCGSALSIFSHWGVRPHLGIAIDPNPSEKEALQGCQFHDLPLIYGNRICPGVFEFFDGPCGLIKTPSATPLEKAIEEELGLQEDPIGQDLGREALSVTTLALSLAQFWGCSPIILAGVDLAYSGNEHYAEGAQRKLKKKAEETSVGEQLLCRRGIGGKKVATLLKWVMEKETIDGFATKYSDQKFIDATTTGLGFDAIGHTPWNKMGIEDVLPIEQMVQKMVSLSPISVTEEQLSQVLGSFQESFLRCLELVKKLDQEEVDGGKAVLYEEDLTCEKVFAPVLQPALVALEITHKLRSETPFAIQKWKFLREIIEGYTHRD